MIRLHAALATLALVSSFLVAVLTAPVDARQAGLRRRATAGEHVVYRGARRGLLDAGGVFVPLARYERIVSGSVVTDSLLLALSEPERVVSFTRYSAVDSPHRYRYSGKPRVTPARVEQIVELEPDLVLLHGLGSAERIARLREAGVTVFDLGSMLGLETLLPNVRSVGLLLGREQRAQTLAKRFDARMRRVAAFVDESQRPGALYVGLHGDKLYGGTRGTSFHDVLEAAGLRDVAATEFDGWPAYTSEQLLRLNPQVVVTTAGSERSLCQHPGLAQMRACQPGGRVVGVDRSLISAPSLDMLDAAEAVFEAVHGPGTPQ